MGHAEEGNGMNSGVKRINLTSHELGERDPKYYRTPASDLTDRGKRPTPKRSRDEKCPFRPFQRQYSDWL